MKKKKKTNKKKKKQKQGKRNKRTKTKQSTRDVPNSGENCRCLCSMKMRFQPGRKMSTAPGIPRPWM